MAEIQVPVEVDGDLATDGGESQSSGALGGARENAETATRIKQTVLDRLPGRVVFVAGAATGSLVTLLVAIIATRFY